MGRGIRLSALPKDTRSELAAAWSPHHFINVKGFTGKLWILVWAWSTYWAFWSDWTKRTY